MVYERYFSELIPGAVHAVMSLITSFTGTLASILPPNSAINSV